MSKACPWEKGTKVRVKDEDFTWGSSELQLPLKKGEVGTITEVSASDPQYISSQ